MSKYNITEIKPKAAVYRTLVKSDLLEELKDKILQKILIEKKYKEKNYSAQMLARELGTNTRYISAVVNVKFHMNYTSFVNKYRIDDAMTLLADRHYAHMTIEEIADTVGFSNRQSFYASFYRILGMTPREYRKQNMPGLRKIAKPSQNEAKEEAKEETPTE